MTLRLAQLSIGRVNAQTVGTEIVLTTAAPDQLILLRTLSLYNAGTLQQATVSIIVATTPTQRRQLRRFDIAAGFGQPLTMYDAIAEGQSVLLVSTQPNVDWLLTGSRFDVV